MCGGGWELVGMVWVVGGGSVVAVGDGLVAWRGCRRLCRGGGGGTRLVEMEVMVASNEDDSEGSGGGVVMMGYAGDLAMGRFLKQTAGGHRRGAGNCAAAVTRWGDEISRRFGGRLRLIE
ncbi:hypothetical protein Tco_1228986 [Tanacetum coccineum]